MSQQSLLAERQFLTTEPGRDVGFCTPDVGKSETEIERSTERRSRRTDFLLRNARILDLGLKRQ